MSGRTSAHKLKFKDLSAAQGWEYGDLVVFLNRGIQALFELNIVAIDDYPHVRAELAIIKNGLP